METGKANNIQANSFNIALSDSYHLSVQIGLTHFSYCITNTSKFSLEYFKNYQLNNTNDIINLINDDEVIKSDFFSSSVAFVNFPSTLIPNKFFTKLSAKEMLELNSETHEIINTDVLKEIDVHLAYSIPKELNNIVTTYFPNAKQKAQQSILIDKFSKEYNTEPTAYIYLCENTLNITAFKNEKLIFNNSFNFETKEDILYFVLFAFEQLKLDTNNVNTLLFGDITKDDYNFKLLYEYIRNIELGERPNQLKFPDEFNTLENQKYFGLFSQILCA
ncbi:DUF3822 family protein [Flavobacteriales bacterium]|nr:DUF3822 family protein [Flavobacteriales bacterium]